MEINDQSGMNEVIEQAASEARTLEEIVAERFGLDSTDNLEDGSSDVVKPEGEGEAAVPDPSLSNVGEEGTPTTDDGEEPVIPRSIIKTPEPTTTTEDAWQFEDGLSITKADARRLAEFEATLRELAAMEEVGQEVTAPEDIDLDDPVIKFFIDRINSLEGRLSESTALIQSHQTQLTTQQDATSTALVNRAVASFAKDKSLTPEQMEPIRDMAASMQILPTLINQGTDPLTALEKALDIAYWSFPEFRELESNRQFEQRKADDERKRKLTSLSSGGGSAPRPQPTQPSTKEEINQAMIAEVAGYMGLAPTSE